MNALIVLTFFVPGFVTEYLRELIMKERTNAQDTWLYKTLRGLWYNVPITAFTWFIIWFWKVVLGNDWYMIQSLEQFWEKCMTEVFMLRYVFVILVGVILYAIGFFIFRRVAWLRRHIPPRPPRPPRPRCHEVNED